VHRIYQKVIDRFEENYAERWAMENVIEFATDPDLYLNLDSSVIFHFSTLQDRTFFDFFVNFSKTNL